MRDLAQLRKKLARYLSEPVAKILSRTPVTPNSLSLTGFLLTVVAAVLIVMGHFLLAGLVVLLAGFFDMLDGALARYTGRSSRFGGALDSMLDRLSEAALLLGILLWHLNLDGEPLLTVLIFLVLVFSPLVSYLRARAEGLGIECRVGLFTRPERMLVLVLGLMLKQIFIALLIIAILSFITSGERLFYIWKQTRTDLTGGK